MRCFCYRRGSEVDLECHRWSVEVAKIMEDCESCGADIEGR
jgi:hypothetical protein